MPEIRISEPHWRALRQHLFAFPEQPAVPVNEQLAFLVAGPSVTAQGIDLVVRELCLAGPEDFHHQSRTGLAPTGEFVAKVWSRCQQEGWSLIEVHSHPFDSSNRATFSGIDLDNDREKGPAVALAFEEPFCHAMMVIGRNSLDAHYYDRATSELLPFRRLVIVGSDGEGIQIVPTTTGGSRQKTESTSDIQYDRQNRLFGEEAQKGLSEASVAIVGLGGLGAFVALQLAHLGVGTVVLIDPDIVDVTNLNRLVGAVQGDVGKPKVNVYRDLIKEIAPQTCVTTIAESILGTEAVNSTKAVDVIAGCVDNHGARLILNYLAVQYCIPLIDAGTGVQVETMEIESQVGGQVQAVLPGRGCLVCRGFIDPVRAAFDLAPASVQEDERAHGYGSDDPAPAVVFLNGVVASLQVSWIADLLGARFADAATHTTTSAILIYDALNHSLTPVTAFVDPYCATCGAAGVGGFADLLPLEQARDIATTLPSASP